MLIPLPMLQCWRGRIEPLKRFASPAKAGGQSRDAGHLASSLENKNLRIWAPAFAGEAIAAIATAT